MDHEIGRVDNEARMALSRAGGGGGGGWIRALDVDLTTQPAQTLTGAGPFTIGGNDTWLKRVIGDPTVEAVPPAIVPGSGIVIATASGKLTSSIGFILPISPLLPSFARKMSTGFRVWIWRKAATIPATGRVEVGFITQPEGGGHPVAFNLNQLFANGEQYTYDTMPVGSGTGTGPTTAINNTTALMMTETKALDSQASVSYMGAYPVGLTDENDSLFPISSAPLSGGGWGGAPGDPNAIRMDHFYLLFSIDSGNADIDGNLTVGRVVLDYRP
jgi:hypothetical protein